MGRKPARQYRRLSDIPTSVRARDRDGAIWEWRHGVWGFRDVIGFWNATSPSKEALYNQWGPFTEYRGKANR